MKRPLRTSGEFSLENNPTKRRGNTFSEGLEAKQIELFFDSKDEESVQYCVSSFFASLGYRGHTSIFRPVLGKPNHSILMNFSEFLDEKKEEFGMIKEKIFLESQFLPVTRLKGRSL